MSPLFGFSASSVAYWDLDVEKSQYGIVHESSVLGKLPISPRLFEQRVIEIEISR